MKESPEGFPKIGGQFHEIQMRHMLRPDVTEIVLQEESGLIVVQLLVDSKVPEIEERVAHCGVLPIENPDLLAIIEEVRSIAGIEPQKAGHIREHKRIGIVGGEGYHIEKYVLSPEARIYLPTLLYVPDSPSGETHLIVHERGKEALLEVQDNLAKSGHVVLSVDLRGMGETNADEKDKAGFGPYFGGDWKEVLLAYLLGESYVGMRANDIFTVLKFVGNHEECGVESGNDRKPGRLRDKIPAPVERDTAEKNGFPIKDALGAPRASELDESARLDWTPDTHYPG